MSYTNGLDNPELYFQCKLYTGDGSANHAITLGADTDMQPDLVWIKNRDAADSHCVFDAVRGATEVLHTDGSLAEATDADTLDSFTSDGFQVDADVKVNTNAEKYVAWCWKESATAGFDINLHTGTGSAKTESHSLSQKPSVMIVKGRSWAEEWETYHTSLGATKTIKINNNAAVSTASSRWNDTEPTSSVFTVGDADATNKNTYTFVTYLFAEKQGFSKFGSYTGNGNVDGTFVYTGFRPAFFMCKRTDSANNWTMYDNKRSASGGYNEIAYTLIANGNDAEITNTDDDDVDFCANGVKIREDNNGSNGSGASYIYMAFAEAPFVNSNGVPCNAR